jgi:hypothetical protein
MNMLARLYAWLGFRSASYSTNDLLTMFHALPHTLVLARGRDAEGDFYAMQKHIEEEYRAEHRAFVSSMPYRRQVTCVLCMKNFGAVVHKVVNAEGENIQIKDLAIHQAIEHQKPFTRRVAAFLDKLPCALLRKLGERFRDPNVLRHYSMPEVAAAIKEFPLTRAEAVALFGKPAYFRGDINMESRLGNDFIFKHNIDCARTGPLGIISYHDGAQTSFILVFEMVAPQKIIASDIRFAGFE